MKLGSLIQNLGDKGSIEKLLNFTLDVNLDRLQKFSEINQKKSRKNIKKKKEQRREATKSLKKYARKKTKIPAYKGQPITGTFLDFDYQQAEIEELVENE